jgi:protein phosphatase
LAKAPLAEPIMPAHDSTTHGPTAHDSVTLPVPAVRKPGDHEVDVYGLTHRGKVRTENQDHFLICSLHRRVDVHSTSLPDTAAITAPGDRLAFLAMVADGVGGGARGEEASRMTVGEVTRYITAALHCYYTADTRDDTAFTDALTAAAVQAHESLLQTAASHTDGRSMATTLTLWLGVWPRAYLLQVGDSRCYSYRGGELLQISRDQTMAQELVDRGLMTRSDATRSRWAHTLSSAIGGYQTAPVVTRMDQAWGDVGLLCSDGLTNHVADERIRERLATMTSARQVCEALVQDALDGGGTDNITVLVGRTVRAAG